MRILVVLILFQLSSTCCGFQQEKPNYRNSGLSIEERVDDLVSGMTLEEKVSQMMNSSVAIPRLDIPAYDWWNEALHGVARADLSTVFSQAIGLAATWDPELINEMAEIISLEAWYPGEEGGTAITDVIFDNYFMTGRTYRYFEKEPLFPFGFGLSYTTFEYSDIELEDNILDACGARRI